MKPKPSKKAKMEAEEGQEEGEKNAKKVFLLWFSSEVLVIEDHR